MIEINLIPDVKRELLRAQTQRNFVISVAIIAAVAAGAAAVLMAAYVYGAQALLMKSANDTIDREYSALSSVEDLDKMLTIQNQLTTVSSLNHDKRISSRLYDMLNVVVPGDSHNVRISSMAVELPEGEDEYTEAGAMVTLEGQTTGSYASLEVFEKMIAAAVIEYRMAEGAEPTGEFGCGDATRQCRYLAVGGGDRATAVQVGEMSFGEDQNGRRTLFFKLSFTVVPELLSNSVNDLRLKIGQDGNVTDSYVGVPRAIFENRPVEEAGDE